MKVGENPKMPYPACGRSIKTYGRGNNDAPSVTKYGSPVWLDAQIVALHPHCAKGAPTHRHAQRHMRMCTRRSEQRPQAVARVHCPRRVANRTPGATLRLSVDPFCRLWGRSVPRPRDLFAPTPPHTHTPSHKHTHTPCSTTTLAPGSLLAPVESRNVLGDPPAASKNRTGDPGVRVGNSVLVKGQWWHTSWGSGTAVWHIHPNHVGGHTHTTTASASAPSCSTHSPLPLQGLAAPPGHSSSQSRPRYPASHAHAPDPVEPSSHVPRPWQVVQAPRHCGPHQPGLQRQVPSPVWPSLQAPWPPQS